MRNALRRHLSAAAVLVATGALLAGCAIPVPEVEADPAPTETMPVLDQPRLDRVLADLNEVLAAGDAAGDSALLAPRVQTPALAVRAAEYQLQALTAGTDAPVVPQPLTATEQVAVVAATDTWPRTIMVVSQIPDGGNTPLLLTLTQENARAPYLLFSWVRLLPGVEMPPTAIPEEGSPEIAADAAGLVATPASTLAAYADLLTKGTGSEYAAIFAADPFRTLVAQNFANVQTSVEAAGTVTETTVPSTVDPVLAIGTANGGAIVTGALVTATVFAKTIDGATLEVGGQIAALAGGEGEVTDTLTATYHQMIAFYVPPAADGATITVLGVERVLSSVAKTEAE